jgi:ATP-dependent exoDNAse (exonuclease V) alpha subunit
LKNERDGVTHNYAPRNSAASAAYRSGDKLNDHDFTNKRGVIHSEIMLPEHAPKEFQDRSALWNAVEKSEKHKDSQTAREIDIALPNELNEEQRLKLVQNYVRENFVRHGMIADFSIHSGHKHTRTDEIKQDEPIKPENPHVHIMLTTRDVDKDGFRGKNREWNKPQYLEQWRENWARAVNREFERLGIDERIDHRTLEAQGIDREPTIHVGRSAERERQNQEIIRRNERNKRPDREQRRTYERIDRDMQRRSYERIDRKERPNRERERSFDRER